ncbi:hypothetical protein BHAOGJBA_2774 [Methylobacterium hispanicum]|uniref:Uncharacterized protein n=3 Tax=Methylobacterium TaxID=407 RepID=A0AAV4ZMA5_9HYPH|nr:hypothetical protein BHAOGJBA_2774 [Methylobacterium hispanicum]
MRAAAIVRSGKSCAFRPFLRRAACPGLTTRPAGGGRGRPGAATWPLRSAAGALYPRAMSETRSGQIPAAEIPAVEVPAVEVPAVEVSAAKVRTAKAKFAEVVLVCRKCARRQGLTKRQARALARAGYEAGYEAGRRAARAGTGRKGRKPRIVESGCLGPCPKRMLAIATGASVAAGRVLLVDPRKAGAFPVAGPDFGPDFGPNATLGAPPGDASATDRGAPA